MKRIVKYANALTHLYGVVQLEKIVEIYNSQNKTQWDLQKALTEIQENKNVLEKNFVHVFGNWLLHESVIEEDTFDELVLNQQSKPFYIPDQNELLNYTDDYYVEETKEYDALKQYLLTAVFKGDIYKAEMFAEDIQGLCQFDYSLKASLRLFEMRGVTFKNQKQEEKIMQLIVDLANNTRLRENNGFTPTELYQHFSKMTLPTTGQSTIKKVGRNDPCPCGSGKKYKKCCLNKK